MKFRLLRVVLQLLTRPVSWFFWKREVRMVRDEEMGKDRKGRGEERRSKVRGC